MYISSKTLKRHLKGNHLEIIIFLLNLCINPCPVKCNLGQIPIVFQEMGSGPIKCFPVSSSTSSLGELKSKPYLCQCILGKIPFQESNNLSLFCPETQTSLNQSLFKYISGHLKNNWFLCQIQKNVIVLGRKQGLALTFTQSKKD